MELGKQGCLNVLDLRTRIATRARTSQPEWRNKKETNVFGGSHRIGSDQNRSDGLCGLAWFDLAFDGTA